MLEVKHLTKIYGGKRAVDDVSFTVERGGILAISRPPRERYPLSGLTFWQTP